jgi:ERCC4-type nuclease
MAVRVQAVESVRFPIAVVIDTREQRPFDFRGLRGPASRGRPLLAIDAVRGTLKSGDYSLEGYEAKISIERKSVADFYGTLAKGRDRFERELARLDAMRYACVVVEGEWSELLAYPERIGGRVSASSIFRSVLAWQQRFRGVQWLTLPTREHAEAATFRMLERFYLDSLKRTETQT